MVREGFEGRIGLWEYYTVGSHPIGVSVSPDGSKLYAVNAFENTVSVINTTSNTISNTIVVGETPNVFGNFISSFAQSLSITSQNIKETNISIFPNPTDGHLTIEQTNIMESELIIYNIMGEVVYKTELKNAKTTIDLSKQTKGIYFVKITDKSKKVTCNKIILN